MQRCAPLDPNSVYCNLLQCHHFANTSILAESEDAVVGFVSAYLLPSSPSTLFIWQVAIDSVVRGKGLALSMLQQLLLRDACRDVNHIHTTITADNKASWALFKKLSKSLNTTLFQDVLFDSEQHFESLHHSEILVSLGPFDKQGSVKTIKE